MKTRRTPRWTTADTSLFGTLCMAEALNRITPEATRVLDRLYRKRRAVVWATQTSEQRRFMRHLRRKDKAIARRWDAMADLILNK